MGTLVCTLELNKAKGQGLILTIVNADDNITQTVQMDGTQMRFKVQGPGGTSTITQKDDSIAIACKTFSVTADETITCTSTGASTYESKDKLDVKSASDMTLTSQAKLGATSSAAMSFDSSDTLGVTSTGDMTLSSQGNVTGSATTNLTLSGQAQVQVSAPSITINADGQLDAKSSGIATLEGSITNVKGNLVNLG
jgi:hypothetical protein